jgi:hypothetical protein
MDEESHLPSVSGVEELRFRRIQSIVADDEARNGLRKILGIPKPLGGDREDSQRCLDYEILWRPGERALKGAQTASASVC